MSAVVSDSQDLQLKRMNEKDEKKDDKKDEQKDEQKDEKKDEQKDEKKDEQKDDKKDEKKDEKQKQQRKQKDPKELAVGFKEYASIDNIYNSITFKKDEHRWTDAKIVWVATEKVHGANYSLCTDGKSVQSFKRSGKITDEEPFYNHQLVKTKYGPKVIELFNELKKDNPQIKIVTVFGELFGGLYPHPDVKATGMKHVQKGVYYIPGIEFYAFDISLDLHGYLSYAKVSLLFEKFGFLYGKPVAKGTYAEVAQFDVEKFVTTIPAIFNLPPIKDNIAEGVVLRPLDGPRMMLKKKSVKFFEATSGKGKKNIPKEMKLSVPASVPEIVSQTVIDADRYVTENRLRAVMSKIGNITDQKVYKVLVGKFTQDILADYKKDNAAKFENWEERWHKIFRSEVQHLAEDFCKEREEALFSGDF